MQATDESCGPLKVVPVRLLNVFLPRLTLSFVWSGGVLQLLQAAGGLVQCAQVVGGLPPAGQTVGVGQLGTQPQRLADGLVEQAGIGGVFDMRLHHEGVSAGVEPLLRAFFSA